MFRVGRGLFRAAYRPQYKWSCWETRDKQSGTRRSFTNLFTLFCSLPMWLMWVKTKTNASWCWIQPSFVRLQSVTSWSQSIPFGMKQTISRGAVFGGEALTVAGVENQKTYVSTVALWCKCLFYHVDFFFSSGVSLFCQPGLCTTLHNELCCNQAAFDILLFCSFHCLCLIYSFSCFLLFWSFSTAGRERERVVCVTNTNLAVQNDR